MIVYQPSRAARTENRCREQVREQVPPFPRKGTLDNRLFSAFPYSDDIPKSHPASPLTAALCPRPSPKSARIYARTGHRSASNTPTGHTSANLSAAER